LGLQGQISRVERRAVEMLRNISETVEKLCFRR
jgi:hypothetical protein